MRFANMLPDPNIGYLGLEIMLPEEGSELSKRIIEAGNSICFDYNKMRIVVFTELGMYENVAIEPGAGEKLEEIVKKDLEGVQGHLDRLTELHKEGYAPQTISYVALPHDSIGFGERFRIIDTRDPPVFAYLAGIRDAESKFLNDRGNELLPLATGVYNLEGNAYVSDRSMGEVFERACGIYGESYGILHDPNAPSIADEAPF